MKRAFLLSFILGLSVIAANASTAKPELNCEPGNNEVAVFTDRDFGGECRTYINGSSPRPYDLKWNDSISSVKIGKNMKMWLCQDIDFEGTCEMLFKSDSWLGDNKVGDDQVSSFSISSRNPSLSDRITRGDNTSALRVTNNSVGRIKLGMTLRQARRVMPKNWKLGPTPGGEGSTLVGAFEGKKLLLEVGSFDGVSDGQKLPPIDLNQKIQFIGIVDSRFKTDKGVHVGMTIANAEKQYGKLNSMFNYPHGGELGDFTNQPKHMNFNFRPKGNFLHSRNLQTNPELSESGLPAVL